MMVPGCCAGPSYENASSCMRHLKPHSAKELFKKPRVILITADDTPRSKGQSLSRARTKPFRPAQGAAPNPPHLLQNPRPTLPSTHEVSKTKDHFQGHIHHGKDLLSYQLLGRTPITPGRSCLRAETGKVDGNDVEILQVSPSDLFSAVDAYGEMVEKVPVSRITLPGTVEDYFKRTFFEMPCFHSLLTILRLTLLHHLSLPLTRAYMYRERQWPLLPNPS
jgi:hypothetical protein